jgi:hypothetical protein
MTKIVGVFTLLAALLAAPSAEAQVYWSTPAAGCVPDSTTIANNRYAVGPDATVSHNSGNIDLITLNCPVMVDRSGLKPNSLRMTFRVSAGSPEQTFVHATFIRVEKSTGNTHSRPVIKASATAGGNLSEAVAAISGELDFVNNYFFIRVELKRADPNQTVVFSGLLLAYAP